MERSIDIEDLLRDGFTLKYAKFYLNLIEKENNNPDFDKEYTRFAHSKGFLASWAGYYGLSEKNINDYLSDYDFYRVWPCNDWTKIWVNDKLTLKLMLDGTCISDFMPEYYYYTIPNGIRRLTESKYDSSIDGFIKQLKKVKTMACKPNNGTMSQGFFKLSFCEGLYAINDKEVTRQDVEEFVLTHPNYVFTEYLIPNAYFRKMNPLIHTIRINTINKNGDDPRIIGSWVRIPTSKTTDVNRADLGNKDNYNLITRIENDGTLCDSKLAYSNHIENVSFHPDSGTNLDGKIENFSRLKNIVFEFCQRYNTLEFLGFDIGATENGFKCMEVNTHPGIMYDQMYTPWMKDDYIGDYFRRKISVIDNMTQEQKLSRNLIK